jgi:hypothetical protein
LIQRTGVVLIDEADAHLHPEWQRELGFWRKTPYAECLVVWPNLLWCCTERGRSKGKPTMKTIITAAPAVLFTAGVHADDVYHGLAEGNPDLFDIHRPTETTTAVQPSVGDSFDRYHGFGDGNTDLFKGDGVLERESTGRPDIYTSVSGNPDLRY